jgi:iron complex outermembrane receptor protein
MREYRKSRRLRSGYKWLRLAPAICGALAAIALPGLVSADNAAPDAEAAGPLQEIVVTATRHEEGLSKVPISVTALTQDAMDVRGIKDFQDIARFTPGYLGTKRRPPARRRIGGCASFCAVVLSGDSYLII